VVTRFEAVCISGTSSGVKERQRANTKSNRGVRAHRLRSEISQRMRGQSNAHSVQDCGEVNDFLCDGSRNWR
jgi:hypothetical protein